MIIPWLIPWENWKFLQCREGDLLCFTALESAKEKQKECVMRGTSHPTAPIGRALEKNEIENGDSPNFAGSSAGKERAEQCMVRGDSCSSHG